MARSKYSIEDAKRLLDRKKECPGGGEAPTIYGRCCECGKRTALTNKGKIRKHVIRNGRTVLNSQLKRIFNQE